eukprot:CAMPEP_0202482190 /NCGR_PEP_ID=MMETSP1361-20130828/1630_1 /ASSEMBLY_ACC=CAM_ASM_000849 /TAXON_ID=210615 /ORGANISM="Staurosira complex sp., Strain CCMP2646" /LENGTH=80 /DNA_ID=CAMNT_0049109973 /DNA_START=59 /DNA_END=301 /DNA_ORIENTATION=-
MTEKKDDPSKDPEIAVSAVPVNNTATNTNGPPIPAGHSRFYCHKCHAPYDLPDKATTWRCSNCSTFNSITQGECEWCTIL